VSSYIDQVFGPEGTLASRVPGYRRRLGQVLLAAAIDEALRTRRHLVAEAPCGIGKSLAQLVPAIQHAITHGKKVVVVTANIALQEQLAKKDLPLLRELLPWPFKWAVLKGRSNYVCQDRLVQIRQRPRDLFGRAEADAELERLLAWTRSTRTGDASEVPFGVAARTWSEVSVSAEGCQGSTCPSVETCFAELARAVALEADIIVTNYHVLGANLAARLETGADCILPPHEVLILDEAHAAADILRECLGFRIVRRDLEEMVRAAREVGKPELGAAIDRARLLDALVGRAGGDGRRTLPIVAGADVLGIDVVDALAGITKLADQRGANTEGEAKAAWQRLSRKAHTLSARIAEVTNRADRNKAYWIEVDDQGRPALCARPIDVGPILTGALFGAAESVCLLSATLTTDGGFGFIRRELGVPRGAAELEVESPFDFRQQGVLVVPDGLPEPNHPAVPEACARVFQEVIDRCRGRTLGLFTSYRNLNAVYERLDRSRYRVLRQGDLPRSELIKLFTSDVHSVLLGTDSFWTGIDVPGQALTAVVIDKLPFPRPDNPVLSALAERDENGFMSQLLPRATITLKQGVGRLIRTQTDVGAVVICDRRLVDKRYGSAVLGCLPPFLRSRRLAAISEFLPEEDHGAVLPG
jgi:ATP-dependent DNA helicase DinG